MTDETQRALAQALAEVATAEGVATRAKEECLAQVADNLEVKLDSIAKATAQDQPDVTRSLGGEGVAAFRAELRDAARRLSDSLRGAVDKIKWPEGSASRFDAATAHKVHSALFNFMYGPQIDRIAFVFKRHGFDIRDDNARRHQSLLLPQYLYDDKNFVSVADALNSLGAAKSRLSAAKAADDKAAVEDLWGD